MRPAALLLAVAVLVFPSTQAEATTWNVPSPETPTIGNALVAAQSNDTILVAAGTYYESGLEMAEGNVVLMGTTGDPADVIVDAQMIGRILHIEETSGLVIRNLTFRNGLAGPAYPDQAGGAIHFSVHASALVENCVFENDSSSGWGGAVAVESNSYPTFRSCVFTGNGAALDGGALAMRDAEVILDTCRFEENRSGANGGAVSYLGGEGGGIAAASCFFTQNAAADSGGALSIYGTAADSVTQCTFTHNHAGKAGGALQTAYSDMAIRDCDFYLNSTDGVGGAIELVFESIVPTFQGCTIRNNTATGNGGGIHAFNGGPYIDDCLFTGNVASAGGGFFAEGIDFVAELQGCTFAENSAVDSGGGGVSADYSSLVVLERCIVAFSTAGTGVQTPSMSNIYASCCDVFGNAGGDWSDSVAHLDSANGNFSADPMFCGPEVDPYRPYMLQGISPCATDTCGYVGAEEVGCAVMITWNGDGDDNSWWNPDNWDLDRVPGPGDDVRILGPEGTWVDFFGGGNADIGNLTVVGPGYPIYLEFMEDTLTILGVGLVDTTTVYVDGGGAIRLGLDAVLTIGGAGTLELVGGSVIGDGTLVNGGVVRKVESEKSRVNSTIAAAFENRLDDPGDGALRVEQGTLLFEGEFTSAGSTFVYDGAAMQLDPGEGPLRADSLTNEGYMLVDSGAVLTIAGAATTFHNIGAGEVELRGGHVNGSGAFHNRALVRKTDPGERSRTTSELAVDFDNDASDPGDGAVRVEEGVLAVEDFFDNAGSVIVYDMAAMLLDPGDGPLRSDLFVNRDTLVIEDGGELTLPEATTVLRNEVGGAIRLQGAGEILGAGTLRNYGLFVKEDLVKSRAVGHVAVVFDNETSDPGDGAVRVDDGTLWVEGEFTNSGSVIVHDATSMLLDPGDGPLRDGGAPKALADGAATNLVGGEWLVSGTLTVADGASLTNHGLVTLDSAASIVNDGAFDLRENGVLAGRGTFDNAGGAFTGGGVIRPGGSVGTLSFVGDFSQTATGEIEVEIGGTTPGSEHDRLAIIGNATLDGALYVTLLPGFMPMEGDSFAVITSGGVLARTSFDCLSGLDAPGDLFLDPVEEMNLFALIARDSTSTNGAPDATNDHDSTDAAAPITIHVLTNDADPEMHALRVALVSTAGTSGEVAILPGDSLLLYTPDHSFSGQDAFTYTVTDCYGGTDVATVTVGVARAPRSWLVPGDQPTITDGLAAAWAKDTVIVSSGTYHESFLTMKSGVVLRSETMDPASVIVDADSLSRGLYCYGLDSTTAVIGITFMGGTQVNGGGALCSNSDMTFDRCVFRGNYASSIGGGLRVYNCDPVIRRCVFEGNAANGGAGIGFAYSNSVVESCLVVSNTAATSGCALYVQNSGLLFWNCTIAYNAATDGTFGSVFYVAASLTTLANTIVFENAGVNTAYCASGGIVVLTCCDVKGNSGGDYVGCLAGQEVLNDNFSADPQFCQIGNPSDRYALMPTSPCAPDNNPACGLVGARPVGCGVVTSVEDSAPPALEYRLFANRPNPFNPTTTIRFSLPRAERATLVVYDIAGRRVATLADGVHGPGELDATWNGTDDSGRGVASGIYFARLAAGEFAAVRKMVLLR